MDEKRGIRVSIRQVLMVTLLGYCGYTTLHADFPIEAFAKWEWVWKALIFAIFLPLTLRTKLRIEALVLTMVLCASSIIITRSEEHTSELQSLMRISYAVFCL